MTTTAPTIDPRLVNAVRALADLDADHASDENGIGYNKPDSHFGHALAATPIEVWTPQIARAAYEMLRKYKHQLERCGMDYDAIEPPTAPDGSTTIRYVDCDGDMFVLNFTYDASLVAAVKQIIGRRWRSDTKQWTVPFTSADRLKTFIELHGFKATPSAQAELEREHDPGDSSLGKITQKAAKLLISTQYDPNLVAAIREIPGRKWDADQKVWVAPISSIRAVRSLAETFNLNTEAIDLVPDADPKIIPAIEVSGGEFVIRFPYDRDLIEAVRDLPAASWDKYKSAWTAPLDAAVEVYEFAISVEAEIDQSAVSVLANAREAIERIAESQAHDAEITIAGLGGELLPFQRAGVAYSLKAMDFHENGDGTFHRTNDHGKQGVIIADEMGLGKTVQALALLQATQQFPAVIVCPTSLRLNWKREATKWLPGRSVQVLYGTRPTDTDADILVIGYDVLHGWQEALEARAVVIDESHYVKNGGARRTQAALRLADRCRDNGGIICLLTGTPVLNNPTELIAQLRIMGSLDDFGGVSKFKQAFRDHTSLPVLNRRLRASCFVRRRKSDVLTELPPKRFAEVVVEGERTAMLEYKKAEADVISFVADRARKIAEQSGATSEEARKAAWKAGLRAEAAEHLVAITTLKRLAAKAKMRPVEDWVADFVDTGKKLVVFGWHREVVNGIAEQFGNGCKVGGGMADEEKQKWVDAFQNDDTQKVISCSIRAAGVGLTLTAASDVLFVEQGWTPADMDQASDRCHRIGQLDSVTAWNMLCAETIDEHIATLIEQKRITVNAVTDGESTEGETAGSVLGDLLVRLAEQAGV